MELETSVLKLRHALVGFGFLTLRSPVLGADRTRFSPLDAERTASDYGAALAGFGGRFGASARGKVDEGAAGAVHAYDRFKRAEGGEESSDVVFCEVIFYAGLGISFA